MYLHSTTIPQPRSSHSQTNPNHDTTILRIESKNDFNTTIPHPWSYNSDSTTRKRIREAVAECEAYARPARTTRSLRAPRRHDFDARAFTRALYAVVKITPGPQTCSRATVGSPALSIRSTASLPPRPQHAADATRRYPTLFRHSHSHAMHFVICERSIVDGHIVDHTGIADGEQGHADFPAEDGLAIPEGKRQYAF